MTTITELEKDVIENGIRNSGFYEDGASEIWSDTLTDTCKIVTKSQISGVVSSLVKKGIIRVTGQGKDMCVMFTEKGQRV